MNKRRQSLANVLCRENKISIHSFIGKINNQKFTFFMFIRVAKKIEFIYFYNSIFECMLIYNIWKVIFKDQLEKKIFFWADLWRGLLKYDILTRLLKSIKNWIFWTTLILEMYTYILTKSQAIVPVFSRRKCKKLTGWKTESTALCTHNST